MLKRKYLTGKQYKNIHSPNKAGNSTRKRRGAPTGPPGSPRGKRVFTRGS